MSSVAAPRPFSLSEAASSRSLRTILVLLAMWLVLGIHPQTRDAFLTAENFTNLTSQVAELVVIGVGMTLVVLIGGIDLSVGAGMALAGVIAAKLQIDMHQPAWIAVLSAVSAMSVLGAWHGVLVTRFGIPPFIATLSGFLTYRGVAVVLADARGLAPMGKDFERIAARLPTTPTRVLLVAALAIAVALIVSRVARRRRLGLPVMGTEQIAIRVLGVLLVLGFFWVVYAEGMPAPVLMAGIAALLGAMILRMTRLGRYAFAIGGNQEAARLSGVPVATVTIATYVLIGALTAVAGVILAARTNGVTPANAGLMRELHVITAVVIGGTSLSGGRGTMVGTVIGALIIGTLANGMSHMGINSNWQNIVTGQILLGAALLDTLSSKKDLAPGTARALRVGLVAAASVGLAILFTRGGSNTVTRGPSVAFLLSTLQEERYQKDQRYFETKAKDVGLGAFTLAADNDNAKQLAQLEDALARGAKVVVIQPTDSAAAASYVKRAHTKGARVVAYDRGIASDDLDVYVAHDSFAVGKMLAEAAVAHTHGKGSFVLLDGQSGHSVANEIARGVHAVLDPLVAKGDVTIVMEQNHDSWSPEQSLKTVEDVLAKTKGDIHAIVAHNSGMARGAVQALSAAGLGEKGIFIGGADADAANVEYVCSGKQSVEVLKDIKPLAERAAEVARDLADGKSSPKLVAVPVHLITKDNAKKLLVDSGFHSQSAVPSCK